MKHQSFTPIPCIIGWNHSACRHPLGYPTSCTSCNFILLWWGVFHQKSPSHTLTFLASWGGIQILQLALGNESAGPEEHNSVVCSAIELLMMISQGVNVSDLGGGNWWNIKVSPMFLGSQARITVHADTPRGTLQVVHGVIRVCSNYVFHAKKQQLRLGVLAKTEVTWILKLALGKLNCWSSGTQKCSWFWNWSPRDDFRGGQIFNETSHPLPLTGSILYLRMISSGCSEAGRRHHAWRAGAAHLLLPPQAGLFPSYLHRRHPRRDTRGQYGDVPHSQTR